MKKMKRLAALFLAIVMVLAMGMTAMAVEGNGGDGDSEVTSYSISVKDGAEIPENHTYKVYQIFIGTLDSTGKILSDIEYGKNYKGNGTAETAYAEAKTITDANKFATDITVEGEPVAELTHTETSAPLPASGYYLVIDVSKVSEGADQVSKFIVNVGGDIEIEPKVSRIPDFEKTVDGKDATVDYASGDHIPFTLTATMKEDVADYESYQLTFTDELSDNLSYDTGSLKVAYKVSDSAEAVEYKSGEYELNVKGKNITVSMSDIGNEARVPGAKIIVTYTATLDAGVTSGEVAKNSASLEFGNNGDTQGVGKTTTDIVKVYTFALDFDKVDEDGEALDGAGFTLYAEDGTTVVATIEAGEGKTNFVFDGLKAGTYILEETTVPDGYNKMENKTIVISASVDGENVTVNDIDDWTKSDFVFTTDIQNYAGVQLPSTGGIGTTIFYVVGGIMVLGACVLLITKKRMSARE